MIKTPTENALNEIFNTFYGRMGEEFDATPVTLWRAVTTGASYCVKRQLSDGRFEYMARIAAPGSIKRFRKLAAARQAAQDMNHADRYGDSFKRPTVLG